MYCNQFPTVIQGGMGAGVSNWRLARAVSTAGQLGVVSGTGLDVILARRLQIGDVGGHCRRAMAHFPIADVAQRAIDRYFVPGGKAADKPYRSKPMPSDRASRLHIELLILASFVEVFLAMEGHDGMVGINFLEKIQLPTLPAIYGAMLAGVTCVLMGAGIPRAIPGIIDRLSRGEQTELQLDVSGADRGELFKIIFDPAMLFGRAVPQLNRPDFVAIVSSLTLAGVMARKANGRVDGLIIEGPTAGGHNAPPRGPMQLCVKGEPIYGRRDEPDLDAIRDLGLPFWLAGSYAGPDLIARAIACGASGVQIGTAFAFCNESGLEADIKRRVLALSREGAARVVTDPVASPTGFPFKVLQLEGTHSDAATYEARARVCDLGYLRHAYKKADGSLGWRCPSEPVADYVRKGGREEDTRGRKCVCNGLLANIGLGQLRKDGAYEKPLITSGAELGVLAAILRPGEACYSARDVIDYLLCRPTASAAGDAIPAAASDAPGSDFVGRSPQLR